MARAPRDWRVEADGQGLRRLPRYVVGEARGSPPKELAYAPVRGPRVAQEPVGAQEKGPPRQVVHDCQGLVVAVDEEDASRGLELDELRPRP